MLGSPWGEAARRFQARRAQVVRVRMALAEWKGERRVTKGDPDDLTTEELVETERILGVAPLAGAETVRFSGFYKPVARRFSGFDKKTKFLPGPIEKRAGPKNDPKSPR